MPVDAALEVDSYSFAGTDCTITSPITEICGLGGIVMNLNQDGYSSECSSCSLNVTITEVDFQNEGTIKGTFTGMFQDINTNEVFPVTNGTFTVLVLEV